jgi:hypothetical protein
MDFRLINSVEKEDECCVCVANAVQVLTSVKMARDCLTPRFVPYYVKFYDTAGCILAKSIGTLQPKYHRRMNT